ncbi:MAG: hypothetical protein RIT81_23690 [Deltaproteobacteria bacterium]
MDAMKTPGSSLPLAVGGLVLAHLDRRDLMALASLKLWSEVGVPHDESHALLRGCDEDWMRTFLDSRPQAIGGAPLDVRLLERARARFARRQRRARVRLGLDLDETRTNLTSAA